MNGSIELKKLGNTGAMVPEIGLGGELRRLRTSRVVGSGIRPQPVRQPVAAVSAAGNSAGNPSYQK